MATFSELINANAKLRPQEVEHLSELVAEWRLLADLSFADLILWLPIRKDETAWPDGYVAIAQIRPTTAATVFNNDLIGSELAWGSNSRVDQALSSGEILRDTQPEKVGELLIKEEAIPVYFEGKTIAVIARHRNADLMRSPSKLELNYREIAHKIYQMVAEGNYPIRNSIYNSESAPRVGDGLIRLDVNGIVFFASPNARSALSRIGFDNELEQKNLGEVFASLPQSKSQPTDESWQSLLSGKQLRRAEYENSRGVIDLLVIPLTNDKDRIGAIVLVHNITELRNRDRALVTKDATIKEIHHRVKNNLQTVSALLRLQSRRVEDPTASAALAEAVRRVASIALVHETLSNQSGDFVEFDSVLDQIVKNAISLTPRQIKFEKLGEFGAFDSKVATALSLVVAELIHNALEHGLADSGDLLQVEVKNQGKSYTVSVVDNGAGLPADFNIEQSANLGLQIANTLTKNELAGEINLSSNGKQTVAVVSFTAN
ncbi:MAG: histidine kinase [Actinobacteria bacterium]|jgi:two-component sensor histidine kinase|uniref:histidine kinase n=1 Tax=freshwater metagenome TaxID=449393 RepID=A0A6J6HTH7_9ZZZZ|nr:histidine kinase [Actinomycetota bacterium]MSX49448.1 histidine kinase [Actinomycetota bacterium]MSX69636.1 histidine kinase [Actinomycetota bacterium]MSY15624.1 histidine kinase [Actinomycetota bacterium]MSY64475.1 histidine kinase [Actinomycetota bacterium]